MAFVVATGKGDGSPDVARAFGVGGVLSNGDFVAVTTIFCCAAEARVICNDHPSCGIAAIRFRVHVQMDTFDFTLDARAKTCAHVKFGGVVGDLLAIDFVVLLRIQGDTFEGKKIKK